MKNKSVYFLIILFSFLSYALGVITVNYKIFPYDIIRYFKNTAASEYPVKAAHYMHKKSFFEEFGQHDYEVVFIGDSISESAQWEDLFPALKIANRGIAGDTSEGVLERIDSILATNAKKAFIMIGINDFLYDASVHSVFENYKKIIEKMHSRGIKVYVVSTIMAGKRASWLNDSIKLLNNKLAVLVAKNEYLTYVDLNTSLAENSLLGEQFSEDGIHLNAKGYYIWRENIKQYL
jgi:lysophospholipase L1-like esterase